MSDYDTIIIGGGPAGATTANLLAKAGQRVLVVEKEKFPRFRIGESLLPHNQPLFDELGVTEALKPFNYPVKKAAHFTLASGEKSIRVVFGDGHFNRQATAMQVERSTFDEVMLKRAEELGADVRHGVAVNAFRDDYDGVSVTIGNETLTADYLVDASGQANVTGNLSKLREFHPGLKKLSVFSHYEGVKLLEGDVFGDIILARGSSRWFWIIPVGPTKTSVGVVCDRKEFAERSLEPSEYLQQALEVSPAMRERLVDARQVMPPKTITDYSYLNRELTGKRLLRVGDAAGFLDPIFSSGVFIAMTSGKRAAEAILRAKSDRSALAQYEKKLRGTLEFYRDFVELFYTRSFMEVLLNPRR
ncbi:MAG: NAD(P)/FAD-dependent oxidoreductase, partial [Limisphaerales bacterium]